MFLRCSVEYYETSVELFFQRTLLYAGVEVNNALTLYQSARGKTAVYDKQIKLIESATHSTKLLMRHDSATCLEVLTAQQTLLQAQWLQTANRLDEMQGVINLYRALGRGRNP
jgi:outer membrane protein TolC